MSASLSLQEGLTGLGLTVPADTQDKLLAYLALVQKWNKVYNLTAVREPGKMLTHHLLESLAVAPHVQDANTVLDVGSGAGLPGIPLALMWPQARVTLLDSNHKKAVFLRQAVIELDLKNTDVVCARVEQWQPPQQFDLVISRAFSDVAELIKAAGPLCRDDGTLAAMKGVYPYEEIAQLPAGFKLHDVVALKVPGLQAERHLVLLRPERLAA